MKRLTLSQFLFLAVLSVCTLGTSLYCAFTANGLLFLGLVLALFPIATIFEKFKEE